MLISRRTALVGGLSGTVAACSSQPVLGTFQSSQRARTGTFSCGVASGDPAAGSVVLWTRLSGYTGTVRVRAEVAEDTAFTRPVRVVEAETGPERDWTVKVVADGLEPGQRYAYRFLVGDDPSPVGLTRTLPEETDKVRLAVASCSHYGFGFFNAYDHIAQQTDVDAVLHLGDYIYEYGNDGYGGERARSIGRLHDPAREVLSLDDYRRRHRQYKKDAACQRMHAAHPMIAVWDDHETSNDSFKNGAENHQLRTEGPWETRKRAALQAYYEYMPVREPEPGKSREQLFKSYSWGKFLTLPVIESRLTARSKQVPFSNIAKTLDTPDKVETFRRDVLGDPSRELLGAEQLGFIADTLKTSVDESVTWRVIANQVLMARVIVPDLTPYFDEDAIAKTEPDFPEIRDFLTVSTLGLPVTLDTWDGYPAARDRFYGRAAAAGARDLIVLTGDSHQFWANDLTRDDGTAMGVELGTSGITSPGTSAYLGEGAFDFSLLLRQKNQDIRYTDPIHQGYMVVNFEEDEANAEFISVSTILEPTYEAFRSAAFDLVRADGTVKLDNPKGLGFKERILFG
ncbi:MAG: alkaline phosphatase D family protein [Pseudomonadota bacterium]